MSLESFIIAKPQDVPGVFKGVSLNPVEVGPLCTT